MRYIEKQPEPAALLDWKRSWADEVQAGRELVWQDLQNPEKRLLHEALLAEQGFLCCYCERRIKVDRSDSHIEHLRPQSQPAYARLRFEYRNLLASCEIEISGQPPPWPRHCGTCKGDWYAEELVSPLEEDCEIYFRFTGSGEILPSLLVEKPERAALSIHRLGLDVDKLNAMRRQVIDGLLAEPSLSPEEIKALLTDCDRRDVQGMFLLPFASAVRYVLREYFSAG